MSLEAKLEALTQAVTTLTERLDAAQFGAPAANDAAPGAGPAVPDDNQKPADKKQAAEPELVWYHKPETREVWQEPEQGRRKGITKVDEATAEKLKAKYAEEDEQAAAAGQPEDDGLDMDMGDDAPADEPMDDSEFAAAWKDWTKRAMAKVMSDDDLDKEAAQVAVKKFIVPKVRAAVGEGVEKAQLADIPADKRRAFLADAESFFA